MNIFEIISEIEKVDPEVYDRLDSRRSIFKHMSGLGQKLTAAAVPLAFGAVLNKAYAQTTAAPGVVDVLNFALRLEYLESTFYNLGLGTIGATATAAQTTFRSGFSTTNLASLDIIRLDESNHVSALIATITALGGTPIAAPNRTPNALGVTGDFDFTGGKGTGTGPFAGIFTTPATFLAVAQALEDTGVRAYKGGAPYLMSNKDVLTAALNIHSVEARHASRLRTMRRAGAANNTASAVAPTNSGTNEADRSASPKSWISGNDNGGPAPAVTAPVYGAGTAPAYTPTTLSAPVFPAENNVIQGGVTLSATTLTATANFPTLSYSEAFDEPLDVPTVLTIAKTFAVTGSTFFG
ncbi:ferritin-like domain-containing protein [Hymenobacter sp. HMF4947]|uniref:Ferritin-like domain-containing protein n=1 Tax=Hymenobacter ginkgonis TaxID=2682976 RepID=A0A7K1TEG4_9BACT|nr:ferritin-like domain-containing protein [Hymenobacter ginkgonis]MVN76790.1 ferritin-like domain-containing protein [Hymenobacter ginkgonis]